VSQSSHSSHGTELATIVETLAHASAMGRDQEPQVRQPARLMGHPLASPATPRTRSTRRRSPEPGHNGRASATSLVMRRPVRGHE
jgi:hypothetical protein